MRNCIFCNCGIQLDSHVGNVMIWRIHIPTVTMYTIGGLLAAWFAYSLALLVELSTQASYLNNVFALSMGGWAVVLMSECRLEVYRRNVVIAWALTALGFGAWRVLS